MSPQVVSFHCTLKNMAGNVISSTYNHDVLTSIDGQGEFLSGLSKGLQNLKKGERRVIKVSAENAYGLYDPKKVFLYPRKKISRDIVLSFGAAVIVPLKSGAVRKCRVVQLHGDMVSLDANHPLAGQDLIFEIDTLSAREATPAEVSESSNMLSTQYLH